MRMRASEDIVHADRNGGKRGGSEERRVMSNGMGRKERA